MLTEGVEWILQGRKEIASLLNAKELAIAAADKRELVQPMFRFSAELLGARDENRADVLVGNPP